MITVTGQGGRGGHGGRAKRYRGRLTLLAATQSGIVVVGRAEAGTGSVGVVVESHCDWWDVVVV